MWQITSGIFMGWSLGANDASHVFGTAVASRMVKFWTAAILCSVFVILGAILEGQEGIRTYQQLSPMNLNLAFIVALAAGISLALMSILGLPVSSSQAIVGAMVLIGVIRSDLDVASLVKIVICWVSTPVGAGLITIVLYFTIGKLANLLAPSLFMYDRSIRWLLIIAGSYASYALGANNVANVTGPFAGPGGLTPFWATLIGSAAIALGVLTYSRKVMMTVGQGLVQLNAFTALITSISAAATVHVFAIIGVPVSSGQAIIGAVLGAGILKGTKSINKRNLFKILFAWIGAPTISAGIALALFEVFVKFNLING
jgi:inorganic phosphate transporter, PiT family